LQLLEVAGRVLTHAELRRTYDRLRAEQHSALRLAALRCQGCGAPLEAHMPCCGFCGLARPEMPQAPQYVPEGGPPAAEPVDYYALLGLTAEHLLAAPAREASGTLFAPPRPPRSEDVDQAANTRLHALLLAPGLAADEREARANEIESARRILRNERRRAVYDALLRDFAQGRLGAGRLDALHVLQDTVLAEVREERGQVDPGDGQALLRQAQGLVASGMARDALPLLRRAQSAGLDTPELYRTLIQAAQAAGDPLSLGSYQLRQVLDAFDALERHGALPRDTPGRRLFWAGLLAREEGDGARAHSLLHAAAQQGCATDLPVWRALAAIALHADQPRDAIAYCQRALANGQDREAILLLMAAACLRTGQRAQAHEVAAQIATLRGGSWSPVGVLHEIGG
jgi:hypothetical protein